MIHLEGAWLLGDKIFSKRAHVQPLACISLLNRPGMQAPGNAKGALSPTRAHRPLPFFVRASDYSVVHVFFLLGEKKKENKITQGILHLVLGPGLTRAI